MTGALFILRYVKVRNYVKIRKLISVFCVVVCLAGGLFRAAAEPVYAVTQTTGTVTGDVVNVRTGAGTGYARVTQVVMGQTVTITGEAVGTDGAVWYAVSFVKNGQSYSGYMHSAYVSAAVPTASTEDTDYLGTLTAAGFPQSYAVYLASLHAKYPNWQFEAVQTGLDWNAVIAGESVIGRNLVPATYSDAMKSTDPVAYNWATNTWANLDGSWVAANSSYIAYIMDPRNYLSEAHIFQFETLQYRPYQTSAGVSAVLANTFMANAVTDADGSTLNYAEAFTGIGANLGVSPYHLASRVKQEQGTAGTSPLISGTYPGYEGYYNYFNVNAYQTATASIQVNGLNYARNAGWNTRYKSLLGGSDILARKYVAIGQNTLYFEKFNVVDSSRLYTHQYMTNVLAAQNEGVQMKKAYTDLNQAFVFRIPVYQNMPESPCTFADTGNPNNWLSALAISGYNMTPAFSGATTEYSLYVGQGVSSISVAALPVASTSAVAGTGTYPLSYGNNNITITCTAQNGTPQEYHLLVVRETPAPAPVVTPEEEPAAPAETTVTILYGDLNGDGRISNADLVWMQKRILGISTLTETGEKAADINHDGKISNIDLIYLKKHILGIQLIGQ